MLRRNILLLHNAALGDFVLTWPLAMALGRVMAQSRVFYVTGAEKGRLAQRAIGVESSDIEAGWHHLHSGNVAAIDGEAKRLLAGAQMVVSFAQKSDEKLMATINEASGGARVISVVPNPPPGVPIWEFHASQLDIFPPIGSYLRQMHDVVRQRGLTQKPPANPNRIIIHPGSGSAAKNWPVEKFVEVAALLKNAGREVIFAIGEVEQEKFAAADLAILQNAGEVKIGQTPSDLFDLLQSAGGYVGNDSGPTHLAAMIGRRTVALFGPASDVAAWSPQGPRVTVLPFKTSAAEVAHLF